jgi:hypothetical protein
MNRQAICAVCVLIALAGSQSFAQDTQQGTAPRTDLPFSFVQSRAFQRMMLTKDFSATTLSKVATLVVRGR